MILVRKRNRGYTLGLVVIAIFFFCCNPSERVEHLVAIDTGLRIPVFRFEQRLAQIKDVSLVEDGLQELESSAPYFTDLFFDQILGQQGTDRVEIVRDMLSDTGYMELHEEVQKVYGNADLGLLNHEIAQGLYNYIEAFELPVSDLPSIYTFISGFAYQSVVFDDGGKDGIALGIEMYLGEIFPYKNAFPKNPLFSDYLTRTYNSDHMSKRIIEVLVEDRMPPPAQENFLSLMIWGGKKLYIMDQILNFKSDTIITDYTAEQLQWCIDNEEEMWDYFFDMDLFYSTDIRSFTKLIAPAPSSPGMPPESPGATGNYMGWQIVKAFMARHPKMSIQDLLSLSDAQQLLEASRYKPAR